MRLFPITAASSSITTLPLTAMAACIAFLCAVAPTALADSLHIAWQNGDAHHHHFHAEDANGNPITGHTNAHQLSGAGANTHYDAYGRWTNETFTRFDGPGQNTTNWSHGYIDEGGLFGFIAVPEFRFVDNNNLFDHMGNAFDPRNLVRQAFSVWSGITSDDPHLVTGLEFREKILFESTEIFVKFENIPDATGAVAFWSPATSSLVFDIYDDDAGLIKHKWFIGGTTRNDVPNNDEVDDFFTVALHEIGHVVGLDHQDDTDDVLYTLAGRGDIIRTDANSAFRALSADDILGARDLYSVPIVPLPASAWSGLALLGLIACFRFRSRNI